MYVGSHCPFWGAVHVKRHSAMPLPSLVAYRHSERERDALNMFLFPHCYDGVLTFQCKGKTGLKIKVSFPLPTRTTIRDLSGNWAMLIVHVLYIKTALKISDNFDAFNYAVV